MKLDEASNNEYAAMELDEDNEETCSNSTEPDVIANDKLKKTVSKLNCKAEKKRGPEIIDAKPLEKGKKAKSEEQTVSSKLQTRSVTKADRSEKLKNIAAKKTSDSLENKEKKKTNVRVKVTENNRGAFLTDAAQMPTLPGPRKPVASRKNCNDIAAAPVESDKRLLNGNISTSPKRKISDDIISDTPVELDQQITESMAKSSMSILTEQQNLLNKKSAPTPLKRMKREDVAAVTPEPDIFRPRRVSICAEPTNVKYVERYICAAELPEPNLTANKNIDPEEDVTPESENIIIINASPHRNLKSILKKTLQNIDVHDAPETTKKCNFQVDPCHEIISKVTLYDPEDISKSNGINRKIEFQTQPFADTYDECDKYQNTLVALMKVELRREIEMEFTHSKNTCEPVTVQVTFQNVEKRGSGRRIIFHCQAESLYKTRQLYDGHLVLVSYKANAKKVEFLAHIIKMQYTTKLGYFEMETAKFTEVLLIEFLDVRPITVITNILNSFRAVYNVRHSPLLKLVLNPLSSHLPSISPNKIQYKGYENLDENQMEILKKIYTRCIDLDEPSISLLNGAAGTGKSTMIVNLVQQLTFGNELRRPLSILICSKSNRNIDEIVLKLMAVRDKTKTSNTKIRLIRYGLLENMNSAVKCVSAQSLKETETSFSEYVKIDNLEKEINTIELKILALTYDDQDHRAKIKTLKGHLVRINTLLNRLKSLDPNKRRDKTTVILNSFNVVCTTVACVPKLQQYIHQFDVCIINEATQLNESLTLLPFQFGMPSLVLVGDVQHVPPPPYSNHLNQMNYGKSLSNRFQNLFLGKLPSPVFELNFQYRMHPEILKWPNMEFYKNHLVPHALTKDDTFPIMPYKVISYNSKGNITESNYIMLLMDILLKNVNTDKHTIGVICTNAKQNEIMRERLIDTPFISSETVNSYLTEKDVIVIWISKEFGLYHLVYKMLLNIAVTRAKKSLIICGADLTVNKIRPIWKSLLDDAVDRKCLHHLKSTNEASSKLKLETLLVKSNCSRMR